MKRRNKFIFCIYVKLIDFKMLWCWIMYEIWIFNCLMAPSLGSGRYLEELYFWFNSEKSVVSDSTPVDTVWLTKSSVIVPELNWIYRLLSLNKPLSTESISSITALHRFRYFYTLYLYPFMLYFLLDFNNFRLISILGTF